jgi:hypothetical protein
MRGFYILKDAWTLEGIDGHLVRQEQHDIPNGAPAMDGELARSREPFDVDGKKWLNGELVAMTQEERAIRDAYDYAARVNSIPQSLLSAASVFREVLNRHFGPNAEANHAVTESAVESYFIGRNLSGTSGETDAADAMILTKGFEAITAWTGDGTIWSFPWEIFE